MDVGEMTPAERLHMYREKVTKLEQQVEALQERFNRLHEAYCNADERATNRLKQIEAQRQLMATALDACDKGDPHDEVEAMEAIRFALATAQQEGE